MTVEREARKTNDKNVFGPILHSSCGTYRTLTGLQYEEADSWHKIGWRWAACLYLHNRASQTDTIPASNVVSA